MLGDPLHHNNYCVTTAVLFNFSHCNMSSRNSFASMIIIFYENINWKQESEREREKIILITDFFMALWYLVVVYFFKADISSRVRKVRNVEEFIKKFLFYLFRRWSFNECLNLFMKRSLGLVAIVVCKQSEWVRECIKLLPSRFPTCLMKIPSAYFLFLFSWKLF